MTLDDETLIAYADGELDAAARAAVEAAMAADSALAQRVARHRELRRRLQAAFEPVLAEPLPERLLASARGADAKAGPGPRGSRPERRWSWPEWGAIAASLVLGVLAAALLGPAAGGGPIVARNGRMFAGGTLSSALSSQLASTQPAGAPVQIGVSFRTGDGSYCRTFVLQEGQSLAGLACHEHGAWELRVVAQNESGGSAGGGYRAAATGLAPAVAHTLDALIAGAPLDAAGEAAARARHWSN
jgi:hypothetical protein